MNHNLFLPLLLLILSFQQLPAQEKAQIKGKLIDAESKEPLAYATIGFDQVPIGTVSNQDGLFQFQFPDSLLGHPITISSMGYESRTFSDTRDDGYYLIKLPPAIRQLDEVVVRPLTPQAYIKKAVNNFDNTLPQDSYGSRSYYRELLRENGAYVSYTEGVFKSYYPAYRDTSKNQHQLLLYRKEENPKRIEFMRKKIDKEKRKEQKKAERKGEEFEDPEVALVESTFGGPNDIFSLAINHHRLPSFLDSTKFKLYRYSFDESVQYNNKELLNIRFKAKNPVEHQLSTGNIYIDLSTNAVSLITLESELVIPALIKPLLFLYGLSINDIDRQIQTRYQYVNGRWFPEYFYFYLEADMKKRHLFDENEKSHFEMEILIKLNEIQFSEVSEIPEDKRFKPGEKLSEQVFNNEGLSWEEINTVIQ
ncbi:carboxypeptidase-like regulatory domain-containing protein [Marinoscillum sp. MHG1-6]|uniref:carboxypeptidase-like regulatory domain-containing protein n=1 Tax=Marinoscillum sp. MHG1-6 TaxID=2959627 RepID=UPI002157F1F5|nr:carboxypeptidase-like regulatory domain-containing protein [Marinoscillum sp. MHG1-6]